MPGKKQATQESVRMVRAGSEAEGETMKPGTPHLAVDIIVLAGVVLLIASEFTLGLLVLYSGLGLMWYPGRKGRSV
jgi:hypothetical protein